MNNCITIVDAIEGDPQGFRVRIGNIINNTYIASTNQLGAPPAIYAEFNIAQLAALAYKNTILPTYKVRVDCTIG